MAYNNKGIVKFTPNKNSLGGLGLRNGNILSGSSIGSNGNVSSTATPDFIYESVGDNLTSDIQEQKENTLEFDITNSIDQLRQELTERITLIDDRLKLVEVKLTENKPEDKQIITREEINTIYSVVNQVLMDISSVKRSIDTLNSMVVNIPDPNLNTGDK